MSNDGWYQLKHNWVTLLITIATPLIGYTAFKINTYEQNMADVKNQQVITHLVDSIHTANIAKLEAMFKVEFTELKNKCDQNTNDIKILYLYIPKQSPIATSRKTAETEITLNSK